MQESLTHLQARATRLLAAQYKARDAGDHDTADTLMRERDTLTDEIQNRLHALIRHH